jgi:hypothetical protein
MRSRTLASVVRKKRDDFIYLSSVNDINGQKVNGRANENYALPDHNSNHMRRLPWSIIGRC